MIPSAPIGGIAGWRFMQRTQESQLAAFTASPALDRELTYFKENISKIESVEDLVNDFTLFKVALGAFGMEEKVADKFFFKKVLEEGSEEDGAFSLRLTDTKFREMAEAFGFGNAGGSRVAESDFAQKITEAYQVRQFEKAVGQSDSSMRLALNLEREISKYADGPYPETVGWFQVMANPPLREVLETALGLPKSIGTLGIDRQREIFQEANERVFGSKSLDVFKDRENVDKLLQNFFAREQINNGPGPLTKGMGALTLMQNAVSAAANFAAFNRRDL
ncbi:MAG: DUF1217 domain-containing protein [Rhodobacteraceae bacterium]|nr:DUF1217 domain-containing protein [Paracoccaceae bacterium]